MFDPAKVKQLKIFQLHNSQRYLQYSCFVCVWVNVIKQYYHLRLFGFNKNDIG